jgi:hypothetical protein
MRYFSWALKRLRVATGTTSGSGALIWSISVRDIFTLLCSVFYPKFPSRVVSLILAHRAGGPVVHTRDLVRKPIRRGTGKRTVKGASTI